MLMRKFAVLALVGLMPLAAAAQQNRRGEVLVQGKSQQHHGLHSAGFLLHPRTHVQNRERPGRAQVGGGIDVKLKPIRTNVYQGTFNLGRMNVIYTADLGATPPTLVAQSQDGGCKWNAVKA